MDPQIAESILGHWYKEKSVNDRYGRISDSELLQAIERMTFDHGETEIWVAGSLKKVIKMLSKWLSEGRGPALPCPTLLTEAAIGV